MSEVKLTKAQSKALHWIGRNEPVGSFPVDGPGLAMVRKLRDAGLITEAGKEPGIFGFVKYATTELGRSALAREQGGRRDG